MSRALAHVLPPPPSLRLLHAEGRVRALLDEVLRLDAERAALERDLSAFAAAWEARAGGVLGALDDAERLVRRLRRIEDELARVATAAPRAAHARPAPAGAATRAGSGRRPFAAGARRTAHAAGAGAGRSEAAVDDVVVEPEQLALKRIHRRLARAVHPDLATGDAERARFEAWMAQVNAAYHRRDLAALEVLAQRIGVGDEPREPTEHERLARLERRALALGAARDSIARDLDRLQASEAFRLRRDHARCAAEGADLVADTCARAAGRTRAARVEALHRYDACVGRAAGLERAARRAAAVARSPLARRALTMAEIGRAGARALELARELDEAARRAEPWEAALTLIAFFLEVGGRVPETLEGSASLAERWDVLRAGWPRAPDLARALARLPRHLELGVRHRGRSVAAGLQLAAPELLSGVRHALSSGAPLRSLAAEVLAVCGPRDRCATCDAEVYAITLLRTRGLDEVHGLACPRCGSVLRSFLRYGAAEGLEALVPIAVEVGLVAEAHVAIGRRTIAFQMLQPQRAALTAGRLARLVDALYVQPHGLPLQASHLAFHVEGAARPLAPGSRVPRGRAVRLRLSDATLRERDVVAWLKARIAQRFRR